MIDPYKIICMIWKILPNKVSSFVTIYVSVFFFNIFIGV